MAERAADSAAVARLTMSDLKQGLVHDREMRAHQVGELEIPLARHGADLERTVALADEGEPLDAVDIDDVVGLHEAEVEHGHQRLPAREELRILQPAQELDRLAHGSRIVIAEWRWFHRCCINRRAD